MYNGPGNLRIGGGSTESFLHPIVLVWMLIAIALIFLLPRKSVVVPLLLTLILAPFGQQIYVMGAHVFVGRILILCGWIRLCWTRMSSRTMIASGGFNPIDKIFLLWAIIRAAATFLEFQETQAAINQCGFLWDSVGGYFLLRFLVRDEEDVVRVIKTFAFIVSVLALTMTIEKVSHQNVFGFMGGRMISFVRDGAVRAQGPFTGPIPAGTFGATLLCLFVWLWRSGTSPFIGVIAVTGSVVMAVTSASSTPLIALPVGILAISFWPLRKEMRIVRWGIVGLLVSLQLAMKAPVWMLINHIDLVGGNSGYHRAMIIDQFVRHFGDWWLIGVQSTATWGWDMWDGANQFVAEGESGGLATLVCFVLLVSRSFRRLGTARTLARGDRKKEWLFWLFGGALFSHIVSFFGISFSDQSINGWFALLAMICAATAPIVAMKRAEDEKQTSGPFRDPLFGCPSDPELLA